MKIAESKTITLRTVSPVFCGSGETLDPLSYVVDDNLVRVIDTDRFLEGLSSEQVKQFESWLIPLSDKRATIDAQIQEARGRRDHQRSGQLSRQRRDLDAEFSLHHFVTKRLGKSSGAFLAPYESYSFRCHTRPDQSGFRLHIKDAQHRPYIPGTEIKGAFRTALLYSAVSEPQGYAKLSQMLGNVRGSEYEKSKSMRHLAENLETQLLRGESKGKKQGDAKYDALRLVQVSDSTPISAEDLRLEMTQSLGTTRFTKTWIETIKYGAEVSMQLTLGDPELIAATLGLGSISRMLTLPGLFQACYQRAKELLEEEAECFRKEEEVFEIIEELIEENSPDAPLIRLGGGQGFLSVTTNLAVKRKNARLYEESIRKNVSSFRRWRTMPGNFPKTRRVIADSTGEPVDCLGWVKMIVC